MKPRLPLKTIPTVVLMTTLGIGFAQLTFGQSNSPTAKVHSPHADNHKSANTKTPEKTQFLKIVQGTDGTPFRMQTAITRYRPSQGDLVVDLIGAVHIGEAEYFSTLNSQFENYDVVLYELVAPSGTRIPAGGRKPSNIPNSPLEMVSWLQGQAQTTLGLESQLEKINYQKQNFLHADLSPAQMAEKMAERGDTPLTIGLSTLSEILRQQNKASQSAARGNANNRDQSSPESLLKLIGDPLKMKQTMAKQFTASGVMESGLGTSLNQLLITDRNAAVMQILQKQIAQGKKKVAIFYGAAHMADFEKRLVRDFGLSQSQQIWIDAWDLTRAGQTPTTDETTKLLFNLLDGLGK